MREALEMAEMAKDAWKVPVGCAIVHDKEQKILSQRSQCYVECNEKCKNDSH